MGISGLLRGARDAPDVWLVPKGRRTVGAFSWEPAATEDMQAGVPGATAAGTEELRLLAFERFGRRGPIALCGADPDRTLDLAPRRTPVFTPVFFRSYRGHEGRSTYDHIVLSVYRRQGSQYSIGAQGEEIREEGITISPALSPSDRRRSATFKEEINTAEREKHVF